MIIMMNTIRKIRNACGLLFLLWMCSACEDWLSVSPKSEVKYDDLFETRNGFKDQLTGIYTALCAPETYGLNVTGGAMDAVGQQYYMGYYQTGGKYYAISRFEYEDAQSKAVFSEIWEKMYNAIANINILLKALEEHAGVLPVQAERIYKGEALGLRAFLHFDLLRMFGNSWTAGAAQPAIPYVKSISKEVTPLSTVSETIGFILGDLEEAAGLLAEDPLLTGESTDEWLGTRNFRFNYYAVKALSARVYLYKNDRENALRNAVEVIGSEKFPWVKREQVTASKRENRDGLFVTECVFMLNNTLLDDITDEYLRWEEAPNYKNLLVMDEDVLNGIFEQSIYGTLDWRRTYYYEEHDDDYFSTRLWQFNNMPEEYKNRQPLMRVSEMYLIAAECSANPREAVGYFNTFRQHRGFSEDNDLPETTAAGALKTEIQKEYRKEFIGEGQYFFYCKRNDLDNLPDTRVPFTRAAYVFPLPDREIEYGDRN